MNNFAFFNKLICDSIRDQQNYKYKTEVLSETPNLIEFPEEIKQHKDNSNEKILDVDKDSINLENFEDNAANLSKNEKLPSKNTTGKTQKIEISREIEINIEIETKKVSITKTQSKKNEVKEKEAKDINQNIDIHHFLSEDIFLEYLKLTKIKPFIIESKIVGLYKSIQNNTRDRTLSKCMTKEHDIRSFMIKYLLSSELLSYYQSSKIKSEVAKNLVDEVESKIAKSKDFFQGKCQGNECIRNKNNASKSGMVCILPNFEWMHQECIEKFFDKTRKKYCEIREKQAKKESIISIMEEDLDDLNKTFIITEYVLNKRLITYEQTIYYI